jgi:hypothetical protein
VLTRGALRNRELGRPEGSRTGLPALGPHSGSGLAVPLVCRVSIMASFAVEQL